ncbi:3975_t:CDS:1, partial [Racocetra persica]
MSKQEGYKIDVANIPFEFSIKYKEFGYVEENLSRDFAISPEGDFLVKFTTKNDNS